MMLTHPTVDKLQQLRCAGMANALPEQLDSSEVGALSFEERLGLLVDREIIEGHSPQLTNRPRRARLKHDACIEDVDFRHRRGLDKPLVLSLADGRWGACRHGYSALPPDAPAAQLARHRPRRRPLPELLDSLAKTDVLVPDDGGLFPLSAEHRHDLLQVPEDRHGVRSTIESDAPPLSLVEHREGETRV